MRVFSENSAVIISRSSSSLFSNLSRSSSSLFNRRNPNQPSATALQSSSAPHTFDLFRKRSSHLDDRFCPLLSSLEAISRHGVFASSSPASSAVRNSVAASSRPRRCRPPQSEIAPPTKSYFSSIDLGGGFRVYEIGF